MKKLLLTSVAALFLATGAAHAAEGDFNCDQLPKYYLGGHFSTERTTKAATLNFSVSFSNNREGPCLERKLLFGTIQEPENCGSTVSSASGVSDA
jgi:hypothetical protein